MTAHKDDTKDSKWIGDLFRKALRPSEYQWKYKSKIPLDHLPYYSAPGHCRSASSICRCRIY